MIAQYSAADLPYAIARLCHNAHMNNVMRMGFAPRSADVGLLVLRLWLGLSLLCLHGWMKLTHFSQMSGRFPDPLHIGTLPSLFLTVLTETLVALLLMIGLATRWAALIIAFDMVVAFTLVHKLSLSGPGSGELAWMYLGIAVAILIAGPGRYSIDRG